VQYRRNRESAFDAGIAPLPTFLKASDVPGTWTASTPNDDAFNNFSSNTYGAFGFAANVTLTAIRQQHLPCGLYKLYTEVAHGAQLQRQLHLFPYVG